MKIKSPEKFNSTTDETITIEWIYSYVNFTLNQKILCKSPRVPNNAIKLLSTYLIALIEHGIILHYVFDGH